MGPVIENINQKLVKSFPVVVAYGNCGGQWKDAAKEAG